MSVIRLSAVVLTLALVSACSGGSGGPPDPPLDPPVGTGGLEIDMRGEWLATVVEVVEQVGGLAVPPPPPTRLFPPVVGSTIEIGEAGFVDLDGMVAATMCMPDGFTARFASMNQQDGRFALLDIGCRSRPDPRIADGGSSRLQCAFGSISTNRMIGLVRIEVMTAPRPAEIPQSGLYRVVLARR